MSGLIIVAYITLPRPCDNLGMVLSLPPYCARFPDAGGRDFISEIFFITVKINNQINKFGPSVLKS